MNIGKLFVFIMVIINFFIFSFADGNMDGIELLNFVDDIDSSTNKISYEITDFDKFESEDIFSLEIYHDGILEAVDCEQKLDISEGVFFKKITCDVPKKGDGDYVFVAMVTRDSEMISKLVSKFTWNGDISTYLTYKILDFGAKIIIDVSGEGDDLKIINEIPKEIIPLLTEENRDSLINSDFEYIIVEADPVIAWSVDKAPTRIEYTINANVTEKELQDINIGVEEDSYLKYLTYVVYVLIFVLIYLILKPNLTKKNEKKK